MASFGLKLFLTLTTLTIVCHPTNGYFRPLYNIGHMSNSIQETLHFLQNGANAIEADIGFSNEGIPFGTYHNRPCDCFRICGRSENLKEYLSFIKQITNTLDGRFKDQFALLFFDLKLDNVPSDKKYDAGRYLADAMINNLWESKEGQININVLISIGYLEDSIAIKGYKDTFLEYNLGNLLNNKIGWDVGMAGPIEEIAAMWKELGISANTWQGDGLTNCFSPFRNLDRLKEAISLRNNYPNHVNKVYHWTIDYSYELEQSLRHSVDGIITNRPERVVKLLERREFKESYRLATPKDSPWLKITYYQPQLPYHSDNNSTALQSYDFRNGLLFLKSWVEETFQYILDYIKELFNDFKSFKILRREMEESVEDSLLHISEIKEFADGFGDRRMSGEFE